MDSIVCCLAAIHTTEEFYLTRPGQSICVCVCVSELACARTCLLMVFVCKATNDLQCVFSVCNFCGWGKALLGWRISWCSSQCHDRANANGFIFGICRFHGRVHRTNSSCVQYSWLCDSVHPYIPVPHGQIGKSDARDVSRLPSESSSHLISAATPLHQLCIHNIEEKKNATNTYTETNVPCVQFRRNHFTDASFSANFPFFFVLFSVSHCFCTRAAPKLHSCSVCTSVFLFLFPIWAKPEQSNQNTLAAEINISHTRCGTCRCLLASLYLSSVPPAPSNAISPFSYFAYTHTNI